MSKKEDVEEYKENHEQFLERELICPYCNYEQKYAKDDGWCYQDGKELEYECEECGRKFIIYPDFKWEFTTQCIDEEVEKILEEALKNAEGK